VSLLWLTWLVGIGLSALPIILGIAGSPSQLPNILAFSSYIPLYSEILYFGIGVAAITIAETGVLLSERPSKPKLVGCVLSLAVLVAVVIMLAVWYGRTLEWRSSGELPAIEDIRTVLFLDGVVFVLCAILRASLKGSK
jgi:hypothetical protein